MSMPMWVLPDINSSIFETMIAYRMLYFAFVSLLLSLSGYALDKPNFLFLVSEDNSPMLGCYGDALAQTPNLDQFAEDSIRFEHAYANAPVCAPSRSTLINGVYATALGSQHMRSHVNIPETFQHFPWYLKAQGYYTSNRKKTDYNMDVKEDTWSNPDWWNWDDAFAGREPGQPFFLMYNTWMSHEGKIHRNPKDSLENYLKSTLEAFGCEENTQALMERFSFDPSTILLPDYLPDLPEVREDFAYYYKCLALMDFEMGLVFEKLQQSGLLEDTIVFYFSDHGGVLPRSKRFTYDSGLRIPLMVYVPEKFSQYRERIKKAKDAVIELLDLPPTVMEMAGVSIPGHFSGQSLLQYLPQAHQLAFGFRGRMDERYDCVRTVTDGRYRYVRDYTPQRVEGGRVETLWKAASMRAWERCFRAEQTNREQSLFWQINAAEQLFDTDQDPFQTHNLAEDPEYQDKLASFRLQMDAWMLSNCDAGLFPEPMLHKLRGELSPWDWIRESAQPMQEILRAANLAISATEPDSETLRTLAQHENPAIRYWAATGFAILATKGVPTVESLDTLARDDFPSVRIAAAEALYLNHEPEKARKILRSILNDYRDFLNGEKFDPYGIETYTVTLAMNVMDARDSEASSVFPELQYYLNAECGYATRMARNMKAAFEFLQPSQVSNP